MSPYNRHNMKLRSMKLRTPVVAPGTRGIRRKPQRVRRATILGTGMCVPERVIDNTYFSQELGIDTTPEWIESRIGIVARHWAVDETSTDLAVGACARRCSIRSSMRMKWTSSSSPRARPTSRCHRRPVWCKADWVRRGPWRLTSLMRARATLTRSMRPPDICKTAICKPRSLLAWIAEVGLSILVIAARAYFSAMAPAPLFSAAAVRAECSLRNCIRVEMRNHYSFLSAEQ